MKNYFNSKKHKSIVGENNLNEPFLFEGGSDRYNSSKDQDPKFDPPNTYSYHMETIKKYYIPNTPYFQGGRFYIDGEYEGIKYSPSSLFCFDHTSKFRFSIVWMVTRPAFNHFILLVILVNSIMMGARDYQDYENKTARNQAIIKVEPYINAIIYTECVLKILAMGFILGKDSYLRDGWNVLDFLVVMSSAVTSVQEMISGNSGSKGMQAFRAFRLLRPLRLIGKIESLRTLIGTLLSSMSALSATLGLTIFVFIVYAIFGMTVWSGALHYRCYDTKEPVNGEWTMTDGYTDPCSENSPCPSGSYCGNRFDWKNAGYQFTDTNLWVDSEIEELFWGFNNFDNLGSALLTVFQVTTTDGWTPMMFFYENTGSQILSWFYFISCVVVCNFFILNLTVGQMMLQYDKEQEKIDKKNEENDTYDVFTQELMNYGRSILPPEFCIDDPKTGQESLLKFIIERDEVILAEKAKEYVSVEKSFFVSFAEGQKQDLDHSSPYYQTMVVETCLAFIEDIYFNAFILFIIFANTVVLCLDKYPAYPPETQIWFDISNIFFTAVFTAELLIKIVALGIRPFLNDGFNIFDAVIVFTSIQGIYVEIMGSDSHQNKYLLILRTFRCFRIFKLFKVGDLRVLVDSQLRTLPIFIPYICLVLFVFYIFALIGMSFFAGRIKFDDNDNYDPNGTTVRENYDTIGQAFLTIFQVLMGAEWRFIWYQNMRACGSGAAVYYVILIICVVIVMINLLMAIMLGNYDIARKISDKRKIFEAIKKLKREVNTPEYITESGKKGLKAGALKYDFGEICDIVFGEFSHHIKVHICKIDSMDDEAYHKSNKIVEMMKKNMKKQEKENNFQRDEDGIKIEEEESMNHHDKEIQEHNYSWFNNSSIGMFHIDSTIRKICLRLSLDNPNYNELQLIRKKINARNIHVQLKHYERILIEGCTEENKPERLQKQLTAYELHQGFNVNKYFENFILFLILVNSILLAYNNPLLDPDSQLHKNLQISNVVFTILFTIELMIRIIAQGFFTNQLFHIEPYIISGWNQLDFIIVISSLIDLIIEAMLKLGYIDKSANLQVLKSLRALRALRPLRAIKGMPQLKQVVNAFLESFNAIKNVFLVGILMLIIFAVIGVSLFKGKYSACDEETFPNGDPIVTKEDCISSYGESAWTTNDSNFDDVIQALRTLSILTTSEGWAGVMFLGVDTTGEGMQPKQEASWGMVWYFIIFMIIGSLFIANLVVGVIIDQYKTAQQRKEQSEDPSNVKVKVLMCMKDVNKESLKRNDGCKEPTNWRAFAYKLVHSQIFDNFIMMTVILNTVTMSMVLYDSSKEYKDFLRNCNFVFTLIFNVEMILKLIAEKMKYFNSKFNWLDMFIVISADFGIIVQYLGARNGVMKNAITVFRILRILRITKLLQRFENVQILVDSLLLITPNVSNVLLLLILVIYIYALIGMSMFAGVKQTAELDQYNNFDSFGRAVLGLVRFSTGEDFQEFMYEYSNTSDCDENQSYESYIKIGNNRCGTPMSIPYFFSYIVVASWMVINLIIAAIIDGLSEATMEQTKYINKTHIQDYLDLWEKYDKDFSWQLKLSEFWFFLADITGPLQPTVNPSQMTFGGGNTLKQKWDGLETSKEVGYMYNEDPQNYFKVRMLNIFNVLKNLDFKVQKSQKGEYYVEFQTVTKEIVTRAFKHAECQKQLMKKLKDEKEGEQDFQKRASLGKKQQNMLKDFVSVKENVEIHDVLEECPKHHLAALIISDHFHQKKERKQKKNQSGFY